LSLLNFTNELIKNTNFGLFLLKQNCKKVL